MWGIASLWVLCGASFAQEGITRLDPPAAAGALGAELSAYGDRVVLSWLEPRKSEEGRGHALCYAELVDGSWSAPATVVQGAKFFANWADFPSVVPGPGDSLVAHWLQVNGPSRYAYDVRIARSGDGGATWREIGKLHSDATETEHGFVSLVPDDGGFAAVWLDGRAMADGGAMSLRAARIDEAVVDETVLDDDVCTCCQTDLVRMSDGGLLAVYRDHTAEEIRDISLVRRTGDGWTEPESLHDDGWRMPACPVNGPSVAHGPGGTWAAWYTAAQERGTVRLAHSTDGGVTFGPALDLDADDPVGRVAVVALDRGAAVAWLARRAGKAALLLCHAEAGAARPPLEIARTSASRSSGFPRMVRRGDELVLAWFDTEAGRLCAAVLLIDEVLPAASQGQREHRDL